MNQVSLVAFYGDKDKSLSDFLADTSDRLKQCLGSAYLPYPVNQVHATLIGLERIQRAGKFYNYNFYCNYGYERAMQIEEMLRFINSTSMLPITITIGGYHKHTDYGFKSFDQHIWNRSCNIIGKNAILIGWPALTASDNYPLANLRRSFEYFGLLHKWHQTSQDVDNDCYFVLGHIHPDVSKKSTVTETLLTMRDYLASLTPFNLVLARDDLSFVNYSDITLPHASTRCLGLSDAVRDPDKLMYILNN